MSGYSIVTLEQRLDALADSTGRARGDAAKALNAWAAERKEREALEDQVRELRAQVAVILDLMGRWGQKP
jgi:hypothetical protein